MTTGIPSQIRVLSLILGQLHSLTNMGLIVWTECEDVDSQFESKYSERGMLFRLRFSSTVGITLTASKGLTQYLRIDGESELLDQDAAILLSLYNLVKQNHKKIEVDTIEPKDPLKAVLYHLTGIVSMY